MNSPSPSDVGRLVHLGIGNFARAHTLVDTEIAGGWSVAAFTGRSAGMADSLNAQGGRYGLIVRGPEQDEVRIVDVIDEVHPAADVDALVRLLADPFTAVVTLTITEKGYSAGSDPATSAPARIALGLQARREAGVEEPIALVSCDNLTGNGEVLGAAVLAELDEEMRTWFADHVDVVSTMVDRITPRPMRRPPRSSAPRPVSTTWSRWSPSPSPNGSSRTASAAAAPSGRRPGCSSPTTSSSTSCASCGCSTAPTP